MKKRVALLLSAVLALGLCSSCGNESAQTTPAPAAPPATQAPDGAGSAPEEVDYPTQTINLIVGFNAGGDTDLNNRLLAQYLEKELGVTIAVTNLGGGNGSVMLTQYKDSGATDGYTILGMNTSGLTNNEATGIMDFGWDAFDPVALFGRPSGEMVFTSKDSGITSMQELIEQSAAAPNTIKYAVSIGGGSHIAAMHVQQAGAKCVIVDGGDGANRLTSLLGGHVQVASIPYLTAKEYVETGDLVPLCVVSSERSSAAPDVPTAVEAGIETLKMDSYYAWVAPKGTDPAIIEILNAAILKVVDGNGEYDADQRGINNNDPWACSVEDAAAILEELRQTAFDNATLLQE